LDGDTPVRPPAGLFLGLLPPRPRPRPPLHIVNFLFCGFQSHVHEKPFVKFMPQ
jgi:hypothetical protein